MAEVRKLMIVLSTCILFFVSCKSSTSSQKTDSAVEHNSTKRYTPADLPKVTGLVVPDNLPELAQRTNRLSAQVAKSVNATNSNPVVSETMNHPDFCSASASSFDFRAANMVNMVTPIKDQGDCGSCWAFATNAVLESSYLALRKENISASEQELISCSTAGTCESGWWAFDFLNKPGIESTKSYPYEHSSSECKTPLNVEFRALRSGYVAAPGQENSVPTVEALKTAMCKHGPLAVGIRATGAFLNWGYDHHNQHQVFEENDSQRINHAIVLIGWDESKHAWLIKNSWSTAWGDDGFLFVKYGTNSIGFGAAWAEAWPKDYTPPSNLRKLLNSSLKSTAKTVNLPE